jgi:hypothetical protein
MFRSILVRSLVKGALWSLVIVAALVIANATTPVNQQISDTTVDCWNPHTAQVTVEVGTTCPTPINPYTAR